MAYRTVNLKPATYRRLRAYRIGGISFDEAVRILMEHVEPAVVQLQIMEQLAAEAAAAAHAAGPVEFHEAPPRNVRPRDKAG